MKRLIIVLFSGIFISLSYSQESLNQAKFDSILREANLLYSYEKVTWNSTDLAYSNKKIKPEIGSYVVHHSGDSIFVVFADKQLKHQIAEYSFSFKDLESNVKENFKKQPLSQKVSELIQIKNIIINQLNSNASTYQLGFHKGYNPNPVLIPEIDGYKLYLIIGTANSNVIPFGNDYLFKTDSNGNILEWKKFHKTLIATQTKGPNGEVVVSAIHSHLKMTPYITATDICTFRLYGVDLYGMKEFMVTSTALNKAFKYNAVTNTISETAF